jgi:ABC-type transport system substrate-binding protein
MAYALDKVELQQRGLYGASFVIDSPIVPSQGIWSCEYEMAECEFPGGETYYEARPDKGNETVLAQGWFDHDGDGWREFFNGTVSEGGVVIWDGGAVYHQHGTETYNEEYNGYTFKGKTFSEVAGVNGTLTGFDSGEDLLKADFQTDFHWIEEKLYTFDITGSAGGGTIPPLSTSITMTVEAFHSIGIQVNPSHVTFSTLLSDMRKGDYNAVLFAHTNLEPDPLFLQAFTSNSESNLEQARWVNSTYDEQWDIISTNTDFNEVLAATYKAQQIWWQEQPKVIMYNNEYISMYRTDKFMDQILVPGEGSFGYWSMAKMRLLPEFYQDKNYPNWPFGGDLRYGVPQPMESQNSLHYFRNLFQIEGYIRFSNPYTLNVLGMIEEKLIYRHPENLTWLQGSGVAKSYNITAPCTTQDCVDADAEGGFKVIWHIRDDIKWHDGDPLLAEDVAFSFHMVYNYWLINTSTKWHIDFNESDKTVTVISNNTNLFELDKMAITIYKKSIWDNTPNNDPMNFSNDVPIGTGLYKWETRTPGEYIILERNNDYYLEPALDTDHDGMLDLFEYQHGLDPNIDDGALDIDGDGMPNLWEYQMGLNVSLNDGALDMDGDGLPNLWEFKMGLNPTFDDSLVDNDRDGMLNIWEYQMGLNASYNDSYLDLDQDGLTNLQEFLIGSWANQTDTDLDGMTDFFEFNNGLDLTSNDGASDKDHDGISNYQEFLAGSQANNFFSVPIDKFSVLHGLLSLFSLLSIIGSMISYIFIRRKNFIRSLGAPDYASAQLIRRGNFKDYLTFKRAHQLGIDSLEEYEFFLEMKELEEDRI